MKADVIQQKVREVCSFIQELARKTGSTFQIPNAKVEEYIVRVVAIRTLHKDEQTIEDEQMKMIFDIVDELIDQSNAFIDNEMADKRKELNIGLSNVIEKANLVMKSPEHIKEEKRVLIAKYKITLKSKGSTAELIARIKKVQDIIDGYDHDITNIKDNYNALMIELTDQNNELNMKVQEQELIEQANLRQADILNELVQEQELKAQELRTIANQLEQEKLKLEALKADLDLQIRNNASLQQDGANIIEDITRLRDIIMDRVTVIDNMTREIREITAQILDYTTRISNNNSMIDVLNEGAQQEISIRNTQALLQAKRRELQDLIDAYQQAQRDKTEAESNNVAMQQQIEQLQQEVITLTREVEQLRESLTRINNEIQQLRESGVNMQGQLRTLSDEKRTEEQQVAGLQTDITQNERERDRLVQENRVLVQNINRLTSANNNRASALNDVLEEIKAQIDIEEAKRRDLETQEQALNQQVADLNMGDVNAQNERRKLTELQTQNSKLVTNLGILAITVQNMQRELGRLQTTIQTFKTRLLNVANTMQSFINEQALLLIQEPLKVRIQEYPGKVQVANTGEALLQLHQDIMKDADSLIRITTIRRKTIVDFTRGILDKQVQLENFKHMNLSENISENMQLFKVIMQAINKDNKQGYFLNPEIPKETKVKAVQDILNVHQNQVVSSIKKTKDMTKSYKTLTFFKDMLTLKGRSKEGKGKEETEAIYKNIDKLTEQIDTLLSYLEYYITLHLMEFYHFVSVFMVPLSVFRNKTGVIKDMAVGFFNAKLKAMREHESELSSMGVKTIHMAKFIQTIETYIRVIENKTRVIQDQNRASRPGERRLEHSSGFEQMLSTDHQQFQLIESTKRFYNISKEINHATLTRTFKQMIPEVETCWKSLKKLPILKDMADQGLNLCKYQKIEGEKGITNMLNKQDEKSNKWLRITEHMLSISPFTYELSQFVFNHVLECLLDGMNLTDVFIPEYVEILNEHYMPDAFTRDPADGTGTLLIEQSYGAFLTSFNGFLTGEIADQTSKKVDQVLFAVTNYVGKQRTLQMGRSITQYSNFKELLKQVKTAQQDNGEKFSILMKQLQAGIYEPDLVTNVINQVNMTRVVDNQMDQYLQRDIQQTMRNINPTNTRTDARNIAQGNTRPNPRIIALNDDSSGYFTESAPESARSNITNMVAAGHGAKPHIDLKKLITNVKYLSSFN